MCGFHVPISLDIIITPNRDKHLIELNQIFGKIGLHQIVKHFHKTYFRLGFELRRKYNSSKFNPKSTAVLNITRDKRITYKHLHEYQPETIVYSNKRDALNWAKNKKIIVAKPPCGSCSRGVVVLRSEKLENFLSDKAPNSILLQDFVESKKQEMGGEEYVGCIRHVAIACSFDFHNLDIFHFPSYWRLANYPFNHGKQQSFIASVTNGSKVVPLSDEDQYEVIEYTNEILKKLLSTVTNSALFIQKEVFIPRETAIDRTTWVETAHNKTNS